MDGWFGRANYIISVTVGFEPWDLALTWEIAWLIILFVQIYLICSHWVSSKASSALAWYLWPTFHPWLIWPAWRAQRRSLVCGKGALCQIYPSLVSLHIFVLYWTITTTCNVFIYVVIFKLNRRTILRSLRLKQSGVSDQLYQLLHMNTYGWHSVHSAAWFWWRDCHHNMLWKQDNSGIWFGPDWTCKVPRTCTKIDRVHQFQTVDCCIQCEAVILSDDSCSKTSTLGSDQWICLARSLSGWHRIKFDSSDSPDGQRHALQRWHCARTTKTSAQHIASSTGIGNLVSPQDEYAELNDNRRSNDWLARSQSALRHLSNVRSYLSQMHVSPIGQGWCKSFLYRCAKLMGWRNADDL